MVKIDADLGSLMSQPNLSISTSPFAPGKIILKRASFPKGQTPAHLEKYLIKKGQCAGQRGKVVYKGKVVPKTAACVAGKRR
ncbi:hypothetical protein KAR91_06885 [Candidatus Pacearchaeota archaeon]|nr:hypothetical protein [Candidatus Pacearchaeota archaeon]